MPKCSSQNTSAKQRPSVTTQANINMQGTLLPLSTLSRQDGRRSPEATVVSAVVIVALATRGSSLSGDWENPKIKSGTVCNLMVEFHLTR